MWLWLKNRATPKWNPGKRSQGLKPAVPWWFNFDPCPCVRLAYTNNVPNQQSNVMFHFMTNRPLFVLSLACFFFAASRALWLWLLAVGCWLLVVGCWLLDVGCWLLDVGCWLLVVGRGRSEVGVRGGFRGRMGQFQERFGDYGGRF